MNRTALSSLAEANVVVLVVDGDPAHPYLPYFTAAVGDAGRAWTAWDRGARRTSWSSSMRCAAGVARRIDPAVSTMKSAARSRR